MATILCNKCKKELDLINDEFIKGLWKREGTTTHDRISYEYDFIIICKECAGIKK